MKKKIIIVLLLATMSVLIGLFLQYRKEKSINSPKADKTGALTPKNTGQQVYIPGQQHSGLTGSIVSFSATDKKLLISDGDGKEIPVSLSKTVEIFYEGKNADEEKIKAGASVSILGRGKTINDPGFVVDTLYISEPIQFPAIGDKIK